MTRPTILAFAVLASLAVVPAYSTMLQTGKVMYNLDSSEFYVGTFGPVTPETIDRFVEDHASAGVTDLLVNVNHQRTNFESRVWDAGWTDLDPDSVMVEWIRNQRAFHEAGYDYPELMLASAREHEVRPWISIRMNDAHLPDNPEHPLHSRFWRTHVAWHLDNGGLDFEVDSVRTHYLALIREVCERYDFDGLELDFLRFQHYFRPGREDAGRPLMTNLIGEARRITREASKRLGHAVDLAVRAPTSPAVSRLHGLDAAEWAKMGLVDLIVASPWWTSANSDIPVESWKAALDGTDVDVAVSIEEGVDSGGLPRRTLTHEEMRGIFEGAWGRGADAVYFFNLFTNPIRYWPRHEYFSIIRDAGDPDALRMQDRRYVVTIADPWSPVDPKARKMLPAVGRDFTRRLYLGRSPAEGQSVRIELVLDDSEAKPEVRVNGNEAEWLTTAPPYHLAEVGLDAALQPLRTIYSVATEALCAGYNRVEVRSHGEMTVRWLEIAIDVDE